MEMLDHTNSVWLHFFNLPSHSKREKNPLNISLCLVLPMAGIKPGLCVQQASGLSITPLPLRGAL